MKSSPSEVTSTLRKKISIQSIILLLSIAAAMAVLLLLPIREPFLRAWSNTVFLLLAIFGLSISARWKKYLALLDPQLPEQTAGHFEDFIKAQQERFHKSDLIRLGVGVVLTIALLFIVIYGLKTPWAGMVCGMWTGFIVYAMMKGWLLMNDGMWVQDLRHSLRDHTSETS